MKTNADDNKPNTITIPCTSVRLDPVTGEWITNPNSSITLRTIRNQDGSVMCKLVRKAK